MTRVRRDLGHCKHLPASEGGVSPTIFQKSALIRVHLRRKVLRLLLLGTENRELLQQVPHPGSIFVSNDAGQTRFGAPQTLASKWGEGPRTIFRRISVDPRRKSFCGCFCWEPRTENCFSKSPPPHRFPPLMN